jgi:hypothetical protein
MLGPGLVAKPTPGPRPTTRYTSIAMEYTSNGLAFQANANLINTNKQIKLSIREECRVKIGDVSSTLYSSLLLEKSHSTNPESSLYSA